MEAYITKQQLRQLGFTQKDSVVLLMLAEINEKVAQAIDAEIPKEIAQNYDQELLDAYTRLRAEHAFNSPLVQEWIKNHIRGIDSIVRDHIEMMLHQIRLLISTKADIVEES